MKRVTNLPQTVLRQLLSTANTRPGSLTPSESRFAARIKNCTICQHFWVMRFTVEPKRCPNCHSTNWDRPFMKSLSEADATTRTAESQEDKQ